MTIDHDAKRFRFMRLIAAHADDRNNPAVQAFHTSMAEQDTAPTDTLPERMAIVDLVVDRAMRISLFEIVQGGTVILMSKQRPDGWPLEKLLEHMRKDLEYKNRALFAARTDKTSQADMINCHVSGNNQKIIALLLEAESLQYETLKALHLLGPDQGPNGVARL